MYDETLVYTPGKFVTPHVFGPNDTTPNRVYRSSVLVDLRINGPPLSPLYNKDKNKNKSTV